MNVCSLMLIVFGASYLSTGQRMVNAGGDRLRNVDANENGVENRNDRWTTTHHAADHEMTLVSVLVNYTIRISKGRAYDICGSYSRLGDRFAANRSVHIEHIIRVLNCVCHQKRDSCLQDLMCYEREMSGILLRHCDVKMAFNLQQNTQPTCYFVQEAANCKMALMTSACGSETGQFAYHVTALLVSLNQFPVRLRAAPSVASCHVQSLPSGYDGFRYDASCPSYFVDDLDVCAARYIHNYYIRFRSDHDLIAASSEAETIVNSCRAFREYKMCVRSIKKSCPRGAQLAYEHQTALRIYRLKMDFICSKTVRKAYTSYLPCYQSVVAGRALTSNVLRPCELLWQRRLRPVLSRVSAYQFYCDTKSSKTLLVNRMLTQLRQCYETAFENKCGPAAGQLIGQLIDWAFTDPHYPRYGYRPDCQLHRTASTQTTTRSDESQQRYNVTVKSTSSTSSSSKRVVCMSLTLIVSVLTSSWLQLTCSLNVVAGVV